MQKKRQKEEQEAAQKEADRQYARQLAGYVSGRAKGDLDGLKEARQRQLEESARLREVHLGQKFHCGKRM